MRAGRVALAPLILLLALGLDGCAEPTLDSRDLEGSAAELRATIEGSEARERFDEALKLVREASSGGVEGTERFSVDGLTAAQVLAEAERIDVRREMASVRLLIDAEKEVLGAEDRLARLKIHGFRAERTGDGQGSPEVGRAQSLRRVVMSPSRLL